MSYTELNKGKLIPVSNDPQEIAWKYVGDDYDSRFYKDAVEAFLADPGEFGIVKIDNQYYNVKYDIESDECSEFCNVRTNQFGEIEFITIHYNGGAHWSEVVEGELKRVTV